MGLVSKLGKWRRMSGAERWLFWRAWWRVVLVRLAITLLPFRRWRRWLVRESTESLESLTPEQTDEIGRIALAVRAASRCFPRSETCLVHAVVGQRLLARASYPGEVHIGVGRGKDGEFEAHAWLECGGKVVLGDVPEGTLDERYQRMTILGSGDSPGT